VTYFNNLQHSLIHRNSFSGDIILFVQPRLVYSISKLIKHYKDGISFIHHIQYDYQKKYVILNVMNK